MLILMLFSPQMSIIFVISTPNIPQYLHNLCLNEVAYHFSLIFTKNLTPH